MASASVSFLHINVSQSLANNLMFQAFPALDIMTASIYLSTGQYRLVRFGLGALGFVEPAGKTLILKLRWCLRSVKYHQPVIGRFGHYLNRLGAGKQPQSLGWAARLAR